LVCASLDFAFRYYSFFVCRNRRTVIIIIHLLPRLLLDDDAFADNSSSSAERHGYKLPRGDKHDEAGSDRRLDGKIIQSETISDT
jgi:hypothetical protein